MKFGWIGLGVMGGAMAERLVKAGERVLVYDLKPELVAKLRDHGADVATSVREVTDGADVVALSLPSPAVSLEVVSQLREGSQVQTVVELSTIGAVTARESAALLPSSMRYIDAPVSGGLRGAVDGTLTVMVSGDAPAIEKIRHMFAPLAAEVVVVGDRPGQAQMVKLANNLLSASAIAVSTEAVLLAAKAGVDPRVVVEVISRSTGRNTAINEKFPRFVIPRTFDSQYRLGLIAKDLRLCLEAAAAEGVPMFVGRQIEELFTLAEQQLGSDRDSLEIVRMLEEWAKTVLDDSAWKTVATGTEAS